jgi:hypothetical protein
VVAALVAGKLGRAPKVGRDTLLTQHPIYRVTVRDLRSYDCANELEDERP